MTISVSMIVSSGPGKAVEIKTYSLSREDGERSPEAGQVITVKPGCNSGDLCLHNDICFEVREIDSE